MSYSNYGGFDQSTQTSYAGNIPAGISENIKLLEIAIEPMKQDGTGGNVLKFHFQSADGALFIHTEFPVDEASVRQSALFAKRNPDDEIKKEYDAQARRFKHILEGFVPEDRLVIKDVKSWEDYMQKVVAVAGKAYDGILFRIKLILNNKDFERFPRIPGKGGFILPMNAPDTLEINPKYDRIVKKEATSEEQVAASNPFEALPAEEPEEIHPSFVGDDSVFNMDDVPTAPAEIDPEEAF